MFSLFRNRNFSLLWTAGLISMIGDWMMIAALPFHVYDITGSALATSGWLLAYIAPGVLFGSVGGVFADRYDRRKVMIAVNLLQVAIVPLLLLVREPSQIWIVYAVGFIEATLARFFFPAESALLPTLVKEKELVAANSLNALNDNLARIIGPAVGGVLLGIWSLPGVVIANATSYLLSALLIVLLTVRPFRSASQSDRTATAQERFTEMWHDWVAGLRLVARDRRLSSIFIVMGFALFGDAILSAILVVFIQDDLGLNATQFGWLLTARGVGGFVGGLLLAQRGEKLSGRLLAGVGLVASGLLLFVMLAFPTLPVLLVTVGLVGLPVIAWMVAFQTMLQKSTEDKFRGRIFGTYGMTASLLMLLGTLLGGVSADFTAAFNLVLTSAIIYVLAGLLAFVMLREKSAETIPDTAF